MFRLGKDLVVIVILAAVLCNGFAEAYDAHKARAAEVLKQIHAEDVSEEFRAVMVDAHRRYLRRDNLAPTFIRVTSAYIDGYMVAEGQNIQSKYDLVANAIKQAGSLLSQDPSKNPGAVKEGLRKLATHGITDVNDILLNSYNDHVKKKRDVRT